MVGKRTIVIAAALLIAVVILSSFIYLASQKQYTGNVQSITLGIYPSEYNSLIYIANDQHYFSANGLEVTLKSYPSGSNSSSRNAHRRSRHRHSLGVCYSQ